MEMTRIEGGSFNPLPQKVPMRYSFSLDQKRILMKHYENGMHGQSLAYQEKIVACAQEAGVDFDIVRNWIGNMRRKRRMETAQKHPLASMMLQHNQSVENKRRLLALPGDFAGAQYFHRQPSNGGPHQPHSTGSMVGASSASSSHIPLPTGIMRNAPLSTRDQNVTQPSTGQQAMYVTTPNKQEADSDRNTSLPSIPQSQQQGALNAASNADRFPDETIPLMRSQGAGQGPDSKDAEWRQQQIQGIMQQVQQSVHQLESLGCECVVATVVPSDGGTYITGTPVAVQYFSEIQKIQAMVDYVNPSSPLSVASDDTQNDAVEETGDARGTQRNQSVQGTGVKKEETERGDCLKDGDANRPEGGNDNSTDSERREGEVIRTGEEVYIVNKEHFIIGTGTLLPAPHRHIELKNAPLC